MEEVLRIQREYGGRGLPREIICRCLCVIVGVLLLGASAKYSDADAAPAAYAGSSTYGGTVSGRLPGLAFVSEKAGIGTFPAGKLKLAGLDLTPVMPDIVGTTNMEKRMQRKRLVRIRHLRLSLQALATEHTTLQRLKHQRVIQLILILGLKQ